jgi:hypothetical protein
MAGLDPPAEPKQRKGQEDPTPFGEAKARQFIILNKHSGGMGRAGPGYAQGFDARGFYAQGFAGL